MARKNIKLGGETNIIEIKGTIQKINKTKRFFEKTNKIYKPSSKLATRQTDNIQINKIRSKKQP